MVTFYLKTKSLYKNSFFKNKKFIFVIPFDKKYRYVKQILSVNSVQS
jgi:hypothetical protein